MGSTPGRATAALALLALTAFAGEASAHALGADCTLRGGEVAVEAYYDDDTPAREARVRVLDEAGGEVAQGRTDAAGRWSFPAPPPGKYRVVVDAGQGHGVTRTITVPGAESGAPAGGSNGPGVPISEGPSREEFTQVPWSKVAVGLAVIGALGIGLWLSRRQARAEPRPGTRPPGG